VKRALAITALAAALIGCGEYQAGTGASESRWITAIDQATNREFRCLVVEGYREASLWCYETREARS
jgi:hypothetical protein